MKKWLEKAVNHYLALDPESSHRLRVLQNKIVTLELLGMALTVQMVFTENQIQLRWDDFLKPDLVIRGTPLNLLHMSMTAREERHAFFADDVIVEGNMELAQSVIALFDELEIDWEEYFSEWVGDVPAHQAGRLLRGLLDVKQRVRKTLLYDLNEYIHEEIQLFPPAEEIQHFFHEVDELRMDVERLEAQMLALEGIK